VQQDDKFLRAAHPEMEGFLSAPGRGARNTTSWFLGVNPSLPNPQARPCQLESPSKSGAHPKNGARKPLSALRFRGARGNYNFAPPEKNRVNRKRPWA